ncbi:MAG: restriction endonuclease subunit S [Mariprofundaceae bacterium]|nr:restriction endonuclease subunit S [Mariprofundaceae bacterium]
MAKIEDLFSELEKGVESLKTAREQLNVYRQSVLKAAFEGRLTESWRNEHDVHGGTSVAGAGRTGATATELESADELLARIKSEREARYAAQLAEWQQSGGLIDGKKTPKPKKHKELPPLTSEERAELPVLPDGWGWSKVDFVANKVTDGEHITPRRVDKGFYLLSARNIQDGFLALDNVDFVPDDEYERIRKRCDPEEGDILISCSGSVGRVCRVPKNISFVMVRSVALIKLQSLKESSKFFEFLLQSPFLQKQIEKGKKATAQANLFLGPIKNLRIIVCSEQEQRQIVQEIESRFSVVEQMEKAIEESLQKAEALRQSILKRAFEGKLVPQNPDDEPASELLARIRAARAKMPTSGRKKKGAST